MSQRELAEAFDRAVRGRHSLVEEPICGTLGPTGSMSETGTAFLVEAVRRAQGLGEPADESVVQ